MIPASLTALHGGVGGDGCESHLLYRAVPWLASDSPRVLGQDGALSGSSGHPAPQISPKSLLALLLLWPGEMHVASRASISPASQPPEAPAGPGPLQLPSPGQGHSWESAGLQTAWSQEGRGCGWVRSGLELRRGCYCPTNPHRRGQVTRVSHEVGQTQAGGLRHPGPS